MTEPATEHPLFYELPLRRACVYDESGGARWAEVMPHVLAAFPQLTPDAWWNLTVAEASFFVEAAFDDQTVAG